VLRPDRHQETDKELWGALSYSPSNQFGCPFEGDGFRKVIGNIEAVKDKLPGAMQKGLGYFAGVDHSVGG